MAGLAERKTALMVLAVSAIAVTMSGIAIGASFTRAPALPAARELAMTVTIDEGLIVTGWNETCQCAVAIDTPAADGEQLVGEYVRWAPSVMIVNAGDAVHLTIKNPRGGDHSFAILSSTGDFSGTTATGIVQGRANSGNPEGTTATITFTALKPGTYTFICAIPYDDAAHKCHPDHETLTGTLIVL